jgi:hypothetical protein
MKQINAVADFFAMPNTLGDAMVRWAVLMPMIVCIVMLDRYFESAAPAAAFGYALGSLTTYGTMRQYLAPGQR